MDEADSMPPYQQNVVYITTVLEQGCNFTLEEIKDMHLGVTWALMWTITGCNGLGELVGTDADEDDAEVVSHVYRRSRLHREDLDENAAFFERSTCRCLTSILLQGTH